MAAGRVRTGAEEPAAAVATTELHIGFEGGATTNEISAEISDHLNRGGNCGLAVPPDVIILDADSERDAAQLAQACPDAPFQRTSRGGHAVLLLPSNLEISNRCRVSLHSELQRLTVECP